MASYKEQCFTAQHSAHFPVVFTTYTTSQQKEDYNSIITIFGKQTVQKVQKYYNILLATFLHHKEKKCITVHDANNSAGVRNYADRVFKPEWPCWS